MQWIAPSEKDAAASSLEKRLWDAADQFCANSGLKAQEYSGPTLGLIFLRFAEVRFPILRTRLEGAGASPRRGSRVDEPAAYHAEGILYLAPEARFDYLLTLPEADRNRSPGLVAQPRPLCRRSSRRECQRRGFQGTARNPERGTGSAERPGAGTGSHHRK